MEAVVNEATQLGLPPNVSDAHTINGHPGPTHNCSQGTDTRYTLSNVSHSDHNDDSLSGLSFIRNKIIRKS